MLASSFIFGGKGFIRSQKTNKKDEYTHIFFKFSKQCGLSPVAWLTTFNTGNYVRITSRQSGRNDLLKTNLTGVPYSLPLPLFHHQIFSRSLPLRHTPLSPGIGYVSASEGERSRFRHISVTTFPFFLVSVFLFFLTYVQGRTINVSGICLCDLSRWITVNFIYSWDRATL